MGPIHCLCVEMTRKIEELIREEDGQEAGGKDEAD